MIFTDSQVGILSQETGSNVVLEVGSGTEGHWQAVTASVGGLSPGITLEQRTEGSSQPRGYELPSWLRYQLY